MARPSKYPPALRERAVRMVMESRADYPHEAAPNKLERQTSSVTARAQHPAISAVLRS